MKLADIIEKYIPGDWGDETVSDEKVHEVFCVRGADIVPISNHNYSDIPKRYIGNNSNEEKVLLAGDIIIEKSGGSPSQSTGRVVFVSEDLISAKGKIVCSNFCVAFRVKSEWNPLYIYYYWQHIYNKGIFFNFEGKTSGIKNLQLENALNSINIEYIPIEVQNQIVASLSAIDDKLKVNRAINHNLPTLDHSSEVGEVRLAA